MKSPLRNAFIATIIMLASVGLTQAITPSHRLSADRPIDINRAIPVQFGDWSLESDSSGLVVNPQQAALLNKLYSQLLSRTYVNAKTGQRVMLSLAYGEDERDGAQLHYPEVCYPAQGFQVLSNQTGQLETAKGSIPVRRLETVQNRERYEPVTYWTMIADRAVLGGTKKKLVEMSYGLRGLIVDGLLFRVSTIDRDSARAFAVQQEFVSQLVDAVPPSTVQRLTGIHSAN